MYPWEAESTVLPEITAYIDLKPDEESLNKLEAQKNATPVLGRAQSDAALTPLIREAHTRSRESYGVPRMTVELNEAGHHVNHKRVERLMRTAGLAGISRRKGTRTTRPDRGAQAAPCGFRYFVIIKHEQSTLQRPQGQGQQGRQDQAEFNYGCPLAAQTPGGEDRYWFESPVLGHCLIAYVGLLMGRAQGN